MNVNTYGPINTEFQDHQLGCLTVSSVSVGAKAGRLARENCREGRAIPVGTDRHGELECLRWRNRRQHFSTAASDPSS